MFSTETKTAQLMIKSTDITSLLFFSLIFFAFTLFPELSFAGTGGEELQEVVTKTEGLITGNGGKLIALTGFVGGLIWAVVSGSLTKFITPTVLGMIIGIGPSIVTGSISALI